MNFTVDAMERAFVLGSSDRSADERTTQNKKHYHRSADKWTTQNKNHYQGGPSASASTNCITGGIDILVISYVSYRFEQDACHNTPSESTHLQGHSGKLIQQKLPGSPSKAGWTAPGRGWHGRGSGKGGSGWMGGWVCECVVGRGTRSYCPRIHSDSEGTATNLIKKCDGMAANLIKKSTGAERWNPPVANYPTLGPATVGLRTTTASYEGKGGGREETFVFNQWKSRVDWKLHG
jgi:hypothetical protein